MNENEIGKKVFP